jgi:cytochrome c oxidase subunit 2
LRVRFAGIPIALLLGCRGPQSALDAHGPAAASISSLFWVFLAVCVVFAGALWIPLVHGAVRRGTSRISERGALKWVLIGGGVLPAITVAALFAYSVAVLGALARSSPSADFIIEVVGQQWWWSAHYRSPDGETLVVTANELHIPVGKRVELRVGSRDVIHSFWVPSLHGKTDQIPGRTNVTWIEAAEPGAYRGQCAEFCGLQHARMALLVIAHRQAEFDAWLARERATAVAGDTEGQSVFLQYCANCHTVRGTAARGAIGPDLTHVGSRRFIAAGTLPNNAGSLTSWITNPQAIKPGSGMPNMPLPAAQLQAVVAYLQDLH